MIPRLMGMPFLLLWLVAVIITPDKRGLKRAGTQAGTGGTDHRPIIGGPVVPHRSGAPRYAFRSIQADISVSCDCQYGGAPQRLLNAHHGTPSLPRWGQDASHRWEGHVVVFWPVSGVLATGTHATGGEPGKFYVGDPVVPTREPKAS